MASEKKVVLVFSNVEGSAFAQATGPALGKLLQKGTIFRQVKSDGDWRIYAATGAQSGQTLWEAAEQEGFVVGPLDSEFDMCVLDADTPDSLESTLVRVLDVAGRNTLIVLVSRSAIIFYGPGIAKGKEVDQQISVGVVAPTVAYAANFPVPAQCAAPIAYQAFKDINLKLNEIKKLHDTINNMEAAIERKSRQPWDKHDCA